MLHQQVTLSESDKWVEDMNAKMQSMRDNQVWCLVDPPPDGRTVGSKWLFKKNTDMDGKVHTFKARLVAKDLGEVAYILGINIYSDKSKRLISLNQSAYLDKILERFKMENSKRENISMQERPNLSKTQGASTHEENLTSRFQQNPGESHWTAVKTILGI
ncbi:hypothetical protein Tco_0816650 [Tanacetum coccineum]